MLCGEFWTDVEVKFCDRLWVGLDPSEFARIGKDTSAPLPSLWVVEEYDIQVSEMEMEMNRRTCRAKTTPA